MIRKVEMDTPGQNKEIVKEFITMVFHNHDLGSLDGIMRDDYIQHNADVPQGKTGFIEFFEKCFEAIPDFRYTLKKIVSDGDIVMTGTPKGVGVVKANQHFVGRIKNDGEVIVSAQWRAK